MSNSISSSSSSSSLLTKETIGFAFASIFSIIALKKLWNKQSINSSSSSSSSASGFNFIEGYNEDDDLKIVEATIRIYNDFPIKNVVFRDVFPIFQSPIAHKALIRLLYRRCKQLGKIDVIVGLDARGFLLGPSLSILLNCAFVPVRKQGKLPGEVFTATYEKEYGKDTIVMQKNSIPPRSRVLIVDDLLATGGTFGGTLQLLKQFEELEIVEFLVIIELLELKGRSKLPNHSVYSILKY